MRNLVKYYLFILISWLVYFPTFSQYQTDRVIGINEGLPSSTVWAVLEANDGTLWFGTSKGVCWYDSYKLHFPTFESNIPQVNNLIQDSKDNIWALATNGIYYCNPAQGDYHFKKIEAEHTDAENFYFFSGLESSSGDIWLGNGNGFGKLNFEENTFKQYYLSKNDTLKEFINRVDEIVIAPDSTYLWLASHGNGLKTFNTKTKEVATIIDYSVTGNLSSIVMQGDSILWMGSSDKGLLRYSIQRNKTEHYTTENSSLCSNTVLNLKLFENESLFIGTDGGGFSTLNVRNMKWKTNNSFNSGISNNKIHALEIDRQGNIWLGHYVGGISILTDKVSNFQSIIHPSDSTILQFPLVSDVIKDRNGYLWIANDENGLIKVKNNSLIKTYTNELKGNYEFGFDATLSLLEDSKGIIWVGNYKGGVSYFKDDEIYNLKHNPKDKTSIPHNDIRAIVEDLNGEIWLATHGEGICKLNGSKDGVDKYISDDYESGIFLQSKWCWDMEIDSKNILWIGTVWGLEAYDIDQNKMITDQVQKYFNEHKIEWVNSISCSKNGDIIITSRSGAFIYNQNDKHLEKINFPVDEFGPVAAEEYDKAVWFAGQKGIVMYNKDNGKCFYFDKHDGLQGNQFMRRSSFIDDDGTIYFGGINGFSYFHPKEIVINTDYPDILFTDLKLLNKTITLQSTNSPLQTNINSQKQITFTHKQNIFKIGFAALNYIQSDKNEYIYKLKGFDTEWQKCGYSPEALYMNLTPGEYILQVKASNNNKVWSEKNAQLHIEVLPPWWKTGWFITILTISVIMLLLLIYYIRVRAIKQQNIYLENEVAFRTTQITEQAEELKNQNDLLLEKQEELLQLNQTKDKFFSIIAHDLKNPMNAVIGFAEMLNKSFDRFPDEKKKKFIDIIAKSSRNLFSLLENLLQWSRSQSGKISFDPEHILINDLFDETVTTLSFHAEKKKIMLEYHPLDDVTVFADYNMIDTVIRNLTSNAIKFTPQGGSVKLSAKETDEYIQIKVQDTGVGMSEEQLENLFRIDKNVSTYGTDSEAGTGLGLILCKEFIDKHFGKIWAESKKDQGSCFVVQVPIGRV